MENDTLPAYLGDAGRGAHAVGKVGVDHVLEGHGLIARLLLALLLHVPPELPLVLKVVVELELALDN
jgi:hypothetical protein